MHDNTESLAGPKERMQWRDHLTMFKRDIYPEFKTEGINLTDAMMIYHMNRMYNQMRCVEAAIELLE